MKNVTVLLLLLTVINMSAQQDFRGFALTGSGKLNSNISSDVYQHQFTTNLRLEYFINKNHFISLGPRMTFTRGTDMASDLDLELGLGYGYIHWFSDRIGLQSDFFVDKIGLEEISGNLDLSVIARVTNHMDVRFGLANAKIFGKSTTTTITQPETNSTRTSIVFSIPRTLIGNFSIRYRIPNQSVLKQKESYEPARNVQVGISFGITRNSVEFTSQSTTGQIFNYSSEWVNYTIGMLVNPIDKFTYGVQLGYSSYDFGNSSENLFEVQAVVRRNWLNADGFGFFAQGGPGVQASLDLDSGYTLNGDAGLTYLIKDRVMLDFSFTRFASQFQRKDNNNSLQLSFTPLGTPGLSANVLF